KVRDHLSYPGARSLVSADAVPVAMSGQERVLREIFGSPPAAGQSEGKGHDRRVLARVERIEVLHRLRRIRGGSSVHDPAPRHEPLPLVLVRNRKASAAGLLRVAFPGESS